MYVGVTARAQGALGGPSPSNRWLHSDAKQAARQAQENGWFLWLSGWWFQTMVHFFYDSLSRYSLSRSFLVGGFKHLDYIFHFIYGMSSFPLTNSIIFQDVFLTTNQLLIGMLDYHRLPKQKPWSRSGYLQQTIFGYKSETPPKPVDSDIVKVTVPDKIWQNKDLMIWKWRQILSHGWMICEKVVDEANKFRDDIILYPQKHANLYSCSSKSGWMLVTSNCQNPRSEDNQKSCSI